MAGFETQIPGGEEPREESPGEAQVRLASWVKILVGFFGVRFRPFEEEALAKALGPFIRRWPGIAEWEAPKKP